MVRANDNGRTSNRGLSDVMAITAEEGPADESGFTLRNRIELGHQADDVNNIDICIVKRELAAR